MAGWALAFLLAYLALAFGLRTLIQLRRTGSSGFSGVSGAPGSAEWTGGVLFAVAIALGVAAPVLELAGVLAPLGPLDHDGVRAAGGGIFFGGFATTLYSQFAMGDSWRIGVDPDERTELVTAGPFALVRNPIFTGMLLASTGLALMLGNVAGLVAAVLLFVAIELQVRQVEEPYLLAAHGATYREYAARAGRFVPRVGRLSGS